MSVADVARGAAKPQAGVKAGGLSFAAFRYAQFRHYFAASITSSIADNVEHVISYWVLWEQFHSPLLSGFAIVSHWVPFLCFSVYFGHLAERYDQRRLIQASQGLLVLTSVSWATLFLTGQLQAWHAVVLLIMHGCAGALGAPSTQMLIYDIVGREHLESAVRLIATSRQVTLVLGPGVGGVLLYALGPSFGLYANIALYLPLILWLFVAPRFNAARVGEGGGRAFDPRDTFRVLRDVSTNRVIMAMIVVAGASALLVGSATQPLMPAFAQDLGTDSSGVAYTLLLASNAIGAVVGGILLESTGWLPARAPTAIVATILWALTMVGFALAQTYEVAFLLMFLAGIFLIASSSISQTLVQLEAPEESRGRVIGLFSMSQMGLRIGSAFSVAALGSVIGIHASLTIASVALVLVMLVLLAYALRRPAMASASA